MLLAAGRHALQQVGQANHRVHWRADFVAHVGQKLGLGPARGVGRVAGHHQVAVYLLNLGVALAQLGGALAHGALKLGFLLAQQAGTRPHHAPRRRQQQQAARQPHQRLLPPGPGNAERHPHRGRPLPFRAAPRPRLKREAARIEARKLGLGQRGGPAPRILVAQQPVLVLNGFLRRQAHPPKAEGEAVRAGRQRADAGRVAPGAVHLGAAQGQAGRQRGAARHVGGHAQHAAASAHPGLAGAVEGHRAGQAVAHQRVGGRGEGEELTLPDHVA